MTCPVLEVQHQIQYRMRAAPRRWIRPSKPATGVDADTFVRLASRGEYGGTVAQVCFKRLKKRQ